MTAPEQELPNPTGSACRRRIARAVAVRRLLLLTAAAVAALVATAAAAARSSTRLDSPRLAEIARGAAAFPERTLTRRAALRKALLPATRHYEFTVADGNTVDINVSTEYPADAFTAQRWANFLASLAHGSELSDVNVYLFTPEQVGSRDVCGSQALACYGADQLYAPGTDPSFDLTAEAVVTHEYGHHVAAHRNNAPWFAIDYGPKRWASYLNVCAKAKKKQFFPGAEDERNYGLNPGEGWAEAYRVYNERRAGLPEPFWQIVANVFYPDSRALSLIEQDVLKPWQQPPARTRVGTLSKAHRSQSFRIATPLDGTLMLRLKAPARARYGLDVYSGSTRIAHARAGRSASLRSTICGQRSLRIKASRAAGAGRFSLSISQP